MRRLREDRQGTSEATQFAEERLGVGRQDFANGAVRIERKRDGDKAAHQVRVAVAPTWSTLSPAAFAPSPSSSHTWLTQPRTLFALLWAASLKGSSVRPSSRTYR